MLLRKSVHASPVNVLDWRVDAAVAAPRLVRVCAVAWLRLALSSFVAMQRLAEASSRWSDSNWCVPLQQQMGPSHGAGLTRASVQLSALRCSCIDRVDRGAPDGRR